MSGYSFLCCGVLVLGHVAERELCPAEVASVDSGDASELLARFDSAWELSRNECGSLSAIALGTGVIPKTAYADHGNPLNEDQSFPVEVRFLLDFSTNRFRIEKTDKIINFGTKT